MGFICLYVLIQKSGQKTAKSHLCALLEHFFSHRRAQQFWKQNTISILSFLCLSSSKANHLWHTQKRAKDDKSIKQKTNPQVFYTIKLFTSLAKKIWLSD